MANVKSGINIFDSTSITIGNGSSQDGYIYIDNVTTNPYIKHNTSNWLFSRDGITEGEILLNIDGYSNSASGPVGTPSYLDTLDGYVTIGDTIVNLHGTTNFSDKIKTYTLAGNTFKLTDGVSNYIVGRYNSGSPELYLTTDVGIINESDIVPVYSFFRDGYDIHKLSWDSIGSGMANRIHQRLVKTNRLAWESGLTLGELAADGYNRLITCTSGIIWFGANRRISNSARSDTNLTELWYYNGASWEKSIIYEYNNTQYYNTTGNVLATLTNNNYAVNWVYKDTEGNHIIVLLGEGDYSLSEAQASTIPELVPQICGTTMILLGRIIVKKSESTATSIQSAFITPFQIRPTTSHNNLSNLQGGIINEYYHLTSAQHTWLIDGVADGYWNETKGGTGQTSYIKGDLLYSSNTNVLSKLPIGSDGYLLKVNSGIPSWRSADHNNLSNIQGGEANGYYHLTQEQTELITSPPSLEPSGFVNRTDSEIIFDGYRTVTIQPKAPATSFVVYENGVKYTISDVRQITVPATTGKHFIYFDSGVLTSSTLVSAFYKPLVSVIYWNGTKNVSNPDERHGLVMDWKTHYYLHNTVGTRYNSGLTLQQLLAGTGAANTNAQISLTGGTIYDEDIDVNIVHSLTPTNYFEQNLGSTTTLPAYIPVFYRVGTGNNWTLDTATTFPIRPYDGYIGSLIGYNLDTAGTWSVASPSNGQRVAYWIVATTNITNPIISIMGQRVDGNLTDAQNNNKYELLSFGTFPNQELKVLYRIIVRTSSAYGNTIKGYIEEVLDLRSVSNLPSGTYVATAHGSLTGLDVTNSHPAAAISTNTSSFNNKLSTADTNVQLALNTLDNHIDTINQVMVGKAGALTPNTDGYLIFTGESVTENFPAYVVNTDGYIKNLTATMSGAMAAAQTAQIIVRLNEVNTALTVTLDESTPQNLAATLYLEQDTSNSVNVVNGDKINVRFISSATADAQDVFVTFDVT